MSLSEAQPSFAYPALQLHVAGEVLGASGRDSEAVIDPATERIIARLPLASQADLDRALEAADRGFAVWRLKSAEERGHVLRKAAQWLQARADAVARVITIEEGKTLAESAIEVRMAVECLEWYAEEGRRAYGRVMVRGAGQRTLTVKEPVGPVAAFAPWNFPLCNPARKIGAALAAGCSIVMKPPEETPGSALLLAQALGESGLPPGVLNMVFGVPDLVSRHLLASPVIRKLTFTGSTVVGKHLSKLASERGIRTTMELGGHAPALVFDDADLELALTLMVRSKFRNAGQVCVAPTRFYVQEGIHDRFVAAFVERAGALKVGNGLEAGVDMGPMAHARRIPAVQEMVDDAVRRGARLHTGGTRSQGPGYFYPPTVVSDVPHDALAMNQEPFGPLALISSFKSIDDAISQANRLPFGLAAYAFTESGRTALRVGNEIQAGMVGLNTIAIGSVDAPFGGIRDSGHGAENGIEGLEACLVTKQISQG